MHITNPVAFIITLILFGMVVMICEPDSCKYTDTFGEEECVKQTQWCEAYPQGSYSGYECTQ